MNYKNVAFWIMIIFIFVLGIYVMIWIKTESFECLNNTPAYMIQNFEKSNNHSLVTCSCTAEVMPMPVSFGINSSGIFIIKTEVKNFNLSSLNLTLF